MKIIELQTISKSQHEDIENLEAICKKHDKLKVDVFLSNELNFNKEIKCYYLLYEEDTLISFLYMFMPTAKEAEISAFTDPSFRQRGYFKSLFQKAVSELSKYSIKEVLLVHEPASKEARSVLEKLHVKYDFSEYLLVYIANRALEINNRLHLEPARENNISEIIKLNMAVFNEDYTSSSSLVTESINSKKIEAYVAKTDSELIGVCNVNLESEDVSIFGLGISPEYQGNGFGKEMLNLIIKKLLNMNISSITLEVDSSNNKAFNLYTKNGFTIKTQFDYYRLFI